METKVGNCTLDFCIASTEVDCESYYVVNGRRITCNGCGSDTSCVEAAATACAGTEEPPAPPPPNESDESCCTSANACGWANDDVCDCGGAYDWDEADCSDAACSVRVPGQRSTGQPWAAWLALLALARLVQRQREAG